MKDKTKVLTNLEKGKTLEELVEVLGMRKQTIEAMIETLEHQGRIREVDLHTACNSCPISKSCPFPSGGREKLYIVTEPEEGTSGDG